jgi:hypothetical protein
LVNGKSVRTRRNRRYDEAKRESEQNVTSARLRLQIYFAMKRCTMFFDFVMSSPLGVFITVKAQALIFAAVVISDCDECGFNDLGKLLFGGLALALLLGAGISILVWKLKARDGRERALFQFTVR